MRNRALLIRSNRKANYLATVQLAELLGIDMQVLNPACQSSRTCLLISSDAGSALDITRQVRQLRVQLQARNWFVAYLPHCMDVPDRVTRAELGLSVASNPSELLNVCGRFLPLLTSEELARCARSSIVDEIQLAGHKLRSDFKAGLKLTHSLAMQAYRIGVLTDAPPAEFRSRDEASKWLDKIQRGEQYANAQGNQ